MGPSHRQGLYFHLPEGNEKAEIAARSCAIFSKARKCFFKKIVRRTVRSACLTDKQLNRLQNNVALREIVSALEGDELEPVNVFPP